MEEFSENFAKLAVAEYKDGIPMFSISVLHGAAKELPDPMDYFPTNYPDLPVKVP